MLLNVLDYIEKETLQKFGDKQAVIDGERATLFYDLVKASKQLALELVAAKDMLNRPVAVFLPKSTESVIANLGITYSGNIYMNLDIKNPDSRIKNILEKIQPEIIITSRQFQQRLETLTGNSVLLIFVEDRNQDLPVNEDLLFGRLLKIVDTDPYCIINTSGSTGTPKGVVLNHKSFIDFTEWAIDVLKIGDDEVIGSLSPLYFDIYSFELCLLMAKGATLIIIPETLATFPAKLVEFMAEKKINWIFWVPTIMVNIANLDLFASYQLPHLRTVWFAGEVFPTKHLNYWRRYIPQAKFVNLYGPIEITLDCTYYVVEKDLPDDVPVPIGFPCRNTDVLILNEDNQPAGVNEKGELCVRGTSLAMGYYNDPEKTAKAFVQNPLNKHYPELIYRTGDVVYRNEAGEIIFAGRRDFQVKHLGYRIDLGEIEHVIVNTWGRVRNGCIVYNAQKKEICLFYEGPEELSPAVFRKDLVQYLPKYMIPTEYRFFSELPRNPNGKIDRNLLATIIRDEAAVQ